MKDFVKLYSTILDSSIWSESKDTRLVWITMLAMADQHGHVEASVGGLARRAQVSREECEAALLVLSSPDPDDKSGVDDGRRIQKTDRGWEITNHRHYRDFRTEQQVRGAERVRRHREKNQSVTRNDVTPRNAVKPAVRPDLEADRDQEADQRKKPEIARAREEAPPPAASVKVTDPHSPAEALSMPIVERAAYTERNKHKAEWFTPEAWPEVVAVAQAVHDANGMTGQARLLPYARDAGVRTVVALFAAGFQLNELLAAVAGVTKSKWWREEGKPRSLGALSAEVIRREQACANETRLSPEQLRRVERAKQGLKPDPRRTGPSGPALLSTILPLPAASGGES